MISSEAIRKFAVRNQTTEMNIVREYLQNLFLSYLYQQAGSDHILFKGGTALRLIYGSPRYSEDLDFTGSFIEGGNLEPLIKKTLLEVNREGLDMKITESKSTSGGFLSVIEGSASEWNPRILINVSLRSRKAGGEAVLISNPFMPSYLVFSLRENLMVREKINALLTRKKPRDFFDLYFIIREGVSRGVIVSHRNKLLNAIEGIDNKSISNELRMFLPRSFWPVIRNLRENLLKEMKRH